MKEKIKEHSKIEEKLKVKLAKIEEIIHSNQRNAVKVKIINGILGKLTDEFVDIHHKSLTDEMTGFVNRWFLSEFLRKEIQYSRRYKQSLTVAAVDIDFLKYINDTYGHIAGDKAIVRVAKAIKESIRSADVVARIGGDEFIIVFPSTTAKAAERVVKRIKETTKNIRVKEGFKLGVSLGVAELNKKHKLAEDLIDSADKDLYEAKKDRINVNL